MGRRGERDTERQRDRETERERHTHTHSHSLSLTHSLSGRLCFICNGDEEHGFEVLECSGNVSTEDSRILVRVAAAVLLSLPLPLPPLCHAVPNTPPHLLQLVLHLLWVPLKKLAKLRAAHAVELVLLVVLILLGQRLWVCCLHLRSIIASRPTPRRKPAALRHKPLLLVLVLELAWLWGIVMCHWQ